MNPSSLTPRILVVDDETPIIELVSGYLRREGWTVLIASEGHQALEIVRTEQPDVVVLDLMLPGLDGLEVCRQLRTFSDAYVLMLTARSEEIDRVVGLSLGADDYLVKPFSPRELVARIKALLRRPRVGALKSGGTNLLIDLAKRTVVVRDIPVVLTAIEFDILALLARDPGVVVSRGNILERVWGPEFISDTHLVDVHVANLRRKIGAGFVETVRGIGYRLSESA